MRAYTKYMQKLLALSIALLAFALLPCTAYAANHSGETAIQQVTINIGAYESTVEIEGDQVPVSVPSGQNYYVEEVDITNKSLTKGQQPTLRIEISADEGYYFKSSGKKYVTITGDATYSASSKKDSDTTLVVDVKLKKIPTTRTATDDLEPEDIYWDDFGGISWDGAYDATKFTLKLYRDSRLITTVTTANTYYDFSSHITQTGEYIVKIRGTDGYSNGDWVASEDFDVTRSALEYIASGKNTPMVDTPSTSMSSSGGPATTISTSTGAWLKDNNGWWYCNADRTYTTNSWQYINNKWYFFNADGYMVTGWVSWKGLWYYCGPSGDMYVSCRTPDGYYVNASGVWVQ
jgi:hypothetical protein